MNGFSDSRVSDVGALAKPNSVKVAPQSHVITQAKATIVLKLDATTSYEVETKQCLAKKIATGKTSVYVETKIHVIS
jgi:hypothetical protein